MKISDVKNHKDAKEYIGNSKSWRKGLRASDVKWIWLTDNEDDCLIFAQDQVCGFCYVAYNVDKCAVFYPNCKDCPISCKVNSKNVHSPANFKRFLDHIKPQIWELKPGEVLKDKIVYERDRIY